MSKGPVGGGGEGGGAEKGVIVNTKLLQSPQKTEVRAAECCACWVWAFTTALPTPQSRDWGTVLQCHGDLGGHCVPKPRSYGE